jgi:hypothetical protein
VFWPFQSKRVPKRFILKQLPQQQQQQQHFYFYFLQFNLINKKENCDIFLHYFLMRLSRVYQVITARTLVHWRSPTLLDLDRPSIPVNEDRRSEAHGLTTKAGIADAGEFCCCCSCCPPPSSSSSPFLFIVASVLSSSLIFLSSNSTTTITGESPPPPPPTAPASPS